MTKFQSNMKLAFYISKVEIVTLKKDSELFLSDKRGNKSIPCESNIEWSVEQHRTDQKNLAMAKKWGSWFILVLESAVFLADFTFLLIGDFNLQRLSAQGCWQDHQLCSYSSSGGFLIKPSWQGRWDSGIGEREGEIKRMRKVRAWCLPPPPSKDKTNMWRERERNWFSPAETKR